MLLDGLSMIDAGQRRLRDAVVDYLQSWGQLLDRLPESEQRRIGQALALLALAVEVETAAGIVGWSTPIARSTTGPTCRACNGVRSI